MTQHSLHEYRQYARMLIGQKNWQGAASIAGQMQQQFSDEAEGFFIGGVVAKNSGRLSAAMEQFESALEKDEARHDAAIELAELYTSESRFNESLALLNNYEAKLTNSSYYLLLAAKVFTWLGLHERAWQALNQANKVQPETDSILARLAECAVLLGRIDVAEPIYKRLIKKYPHFQKHHYDYSKLKRAENDEHVQQMKQMLQQNGQPPQNNIYLYYALGKELEDLEQWHEAFSYYEQAGNAILSNANYSVDKDIQTFNDVIGLCSREWLENGKNTACNEHATPVFIVGLPRTGTTLIERVLASHHEVESADETFFFPTAINLEAGIKRFSEIDAEMISRAASSDLQSVASRYLEMVGFRLSGKSHFIDKYPLNFLLLGFIAKAFPKAKLIYLHRQPLDACFAMFKQSYFKFSYSLDDLAKYYAAHDQLRKHWFDVLGDRLIEVSYETFVASPETSTRQLLNELGLEFDPACLEFYNNPTASATASTLQVREKVHTRSVGKWQHFSNELAPLVSFLEQKGILSIS